MRILSKLAAGAAALVGSAIAMPAQVQPHAGLWKFISDGTTNEPYRNIIGGDFTGHGYADVAYLAGDTLHSKVMVASAPAIHNCVVPVAPGVAAMDIARVAGAGVGGCDGLAIASTTGLYIWTTAGVTQVDTRSWYTVASGDIDGNGTADLIGADHTNTQVLVVLRSAAGSTAASFSYPGQSVRDVATVQWNGSGGEEVAIVTDVGLHVRDQAAQSDLLFVRRSNLASIGLAALTMGADTGLVWLARLPSGANSLVTARPGQPTEYLNVDALAPSSIWVADWQGDGYSDVAIGSEASSAVRVLLNQRSIGQPTSTFGLVNGQIEGFNHLPPGESVVVSGVWIGDFDADGHGDAVLVRRDLGGLEIMRGGNYGDAPLPNMPDDFQPPYVDSGSTRTWMLSVSCDSRPAGATQLEFICFASNQTVENQTSGVTMQPQATAHICVPLSSVATSAPINIEWQEQLFTASSTFKLGIVRYRSDTRVWAPCSFAFADGLQCFSAFHSWCDAQTYWEAVGMVLDQSIITSNAATSGTTKPAPPPPPPSPPEPPTPIF